MSRIIQFLPLFIIMLMLGCAAQSPATGGPMDKQGPVLISVHPVDESLNISTEQKIILTFSELLDPVSIPASIQIGSDLEYKLKIRGRRLIIQPKSVWPEDGLIRINLSRKIRDYQKNMMAEPIQLIFSTGEMIPRTTITGKVIDYNPKNLVELGLYKWPPSDSSTIIQKVEADENGSFQFRSIDYQRYTIAAIEGVITDVGKQMENKKYALQTSNFILLSPENEHEHVKLLLSEPLKQLKITSVEMINQYCANLLMNDNSGEVFIIDTLKIPGDSIFVNLEKSNRLTTYHIPEYLFILPEITDTLAPKLSQSIFESDTLTLLFSEPVILKPEAIIIPRDSINIPQPYQVKNTYIVTIAHIPDSVTSIKLIGEYIQDWAGNIFTDSVKTVNIRRNQEEEHIIGGNILGSVSYDGKQSVKIEAHKIGSESYYMTDVENKKYNLSNLVSGLYEIWAFEVLNTRDPDVYFSGIWYPYRRAAQFAMYPDTVEVRARWDIEGINLYFE